MARKCRRLERIPGSRFYRWHCDRCGTPMRVSVWVDKLTGDENPSRYECEQCNPPHHGVGNAHSVPDEDSFGSWGRHVRLYEDEG